MVGWQRLLLAVICGVYFCVEPCVATRSVPGHVDRAALLEDGELRERRPKRPLSQTIKGSTPIKGANEVTSASTEKDTDSEAISPLTISDKASYDGSDSDSSEYDLNDLARPTGTYTLPKGTSVTVRAYWMRHGMSCANLIRQFSLFGVFTQHTYADPSLTDCAIKHAKGLGRKIRRKLKKDSGNWTSPLLVFSSVLVRSMETALYNFPRQKVYPIPYIAEKDNFADNVPLPWFIPNKVGNKRDQKESKLDRAPNHKSTIKRLIYNDEVNPADDPERSGESKADYTFFKNEFPKILSMLLPEKFIQEGAIIPVVIVSHSGYMKNNLGCRGTEKPYNNEVWVKDYHAELMNRDQLVSSVMLKTDFCLRRAATAPPMREVDDKCGITVLDPSVYPKYVGVTKGSGVFKQTKVCELDVFRCSRTNFFMPEELQNSTCCQENYVEDSQRFLRRKSEEVKRISLH